MQQIDYTSIGGIKHCTEHGALNALIVIDCVTKNISCPIVSILSVIYWFWPDTTHYPHYPAQWLNNAGYHYSQQQIARLVICVSTFSVTIRTSYCFFVLCLLKRNEYLRWYLFHGFLFSQSLTIKYKAWLNKEWSLYTWTKLPFCEQDRWDPF